MPASIRRSLICLALLSGSVSVVAQVATGSYQFGTFDNKGFDAINVGNLNVHFSLPVLNKSGRGLPFSYALSYDSSVWQPVTSNGTTSWSPIAGFGWHGVTENITGYISNTLLVDQTRWMNGKIQMICTQTNESNWVYHDPFGVPHPFGGQVVTYLTCQGNPQGINNPPTKALDGSGYNYSGFVLVNKAGTVIKPGNPPSQPFLAGGVTDSNGNEITNDASGNFTDTTGNVVLSVGGAGQAPSPETYTYHDSSGNPQSVQVNFKSYTVQTAFGCTAKEYGPVATPLVDSIVYPDGSTYHFSYEATPNIPANVTGRIAGVSLPTGGTISYSYTGGSQGISCADGSTVGLTRSLAADSGSAASTWTYLRTPGTSTSHTEVTDGLSNHSAYDFVEASNQPSGITAVYYETNRAQYQGTKTGNPLLARQTCYNGQAQPCTTATFSLPISQIDTYETLNAIQQHGMTQKYNANGMETEEDDYDFGGASARGSLLRKEVWTYSTSGIADLVSADQVYDGSNNLANQTLYTYDGSTPTSSSGVPQHVAASGSRGNLTNIVQYSSATATISSSATYEDTGSALTTVTPNGTTNYSYDSTFVYTSGVTPPTPSSGIPLPNSATYDQSHTGLPLTVTDPNNSQASFKTYDSMLRPTEIDSLDASSNLVGKATYVYTPTQTSFYNYQSASTYANTQTLYDAYGRQGRFVVFNGNANPSLDWYQQDTCYDANGNATFQSYRYQGPGFVAGKVCSGAGDLYTYDALGRVKTITHADNTTIQYTYTGRAVQFTDENGVSRITQIDGLGRPTAVCEISSSTLQSVAPSPCELDISGTGFSTAYVYDFANHKTTVTQGAQTRVFQTDWLGRTISVTEPEASAPTTYSYAYNSTGLVVTRQRPKANQTNAGTLTTTTTQYDSVGRVVSVTYDDNLTPNKQFIYDAEQGWTPSVTNLKGRLAVMGAMTSSGASHSGSLFSYDAMGRVLNMWQCGPSTCASNQNSHPLSFSYDWAGNLTSEFDGASGNIAYARSPAGEVTSITNESYQSTGNPPNLVSSVANGPNGPTSYQLGNGVGQAFQYDSLGRRTAGWACQGSTQPSCTGGTSLYYYAAFTFKGVRNIGGCDTSLNRCESFGYDEFNRLTSQSVGSGTVQNFTYAYDRYGNRWQQNVTAGSGPSSNLSFNTSNNHVTNSGYSYDAAGNLTNDSFHSYTYDADGNILTVDGGSTGQYVYDALNRRVWTNVAGTTNEYLYDYAGRRISTWAQPSNFGDEGRIYWDGTQIAFRAIDGTTYFDHQDWQNTERTRTSYTGAIASNYISLPFGDGYTANLPQPNADQDNSGFAELDRDAETSTDHAVFRQYSPAQGRWMSPDHYSGSYDITNPQSMNRYSYVLNNPLAYIDPSGLDDCPPLSAIARGGVHANDDCGTDGGGGGGILPPPGPPESNPCLGFEGCVQGDPPPSPEPTPPPTDPCDYTDCFGSPQQPISFGGGAPSNGQEPPPACQAKILNATNNQFGTNYTNSNVTNTFNFSTGAGPGQGTLNLNISGSTAGVSTGYYPVHWWTYAIGFGPTLHVVGGDVLDSPQTLQFGPNQGTFHIDSGFPYNPIGAFAHWLLNMTKAGGYPKC